MKRIWTIWGITLLTAVLVLGGIAWGVSAFLSAGYSAGAFALAVFGGPAGLTCVIVLTCWLDEEVPK